MFKEFKVFNFRQIYLNVLLKLMHKTSILSNNIHIIIVPKRLDTFRLFEPKCITAFNHSSIFGPRLYNKFITKYPDTINVSNAHLKNVRKQFVLQH